MDLSVRDSACPDIYAPCFWTGQCGVRSLGSAGHHTGASVELRLLKPRQSLLIPPLMFYASREVYMWVKIRCKYVWLMGKFCTQFNLLATFIAAPRNDLMEVRHDRHGSKSTAMISQLPRDQWYVANVRVTHHGSIIEFERESYRKQHQRKDQPSRKTTTLNRPSLLSRNRPDI